MEEETEAWEVKLCALGMWLPNFSDTSYGNTCNSHLTSILASYSVQHSIFCAILLHFLLFHYVFLKMFIYGCAGSLLLHAGFL